MKIKTILKQLSLITLVIFIYACSSSDDSSSDDGNNNQVVTSINISTSNTTVFEGTSVNFTVTNNLNQDVTSSSELKINNTTITNPYVFNTIGSYNVVATNGSFTDTITITVEELPVPTAITIQANKEEFWFDDTVTFTVTDDLGNNLTAVTDIFSNETTITSPYVYNTAGDFSVYATFEVPNEDTVLTSNTITLKTVESTHTTKVMVEDYTGTWCGYCPRLATALEDAVAQNANVIPVAIHDDAEMEFVYANQMESAFGVNGFPTGKVNRTITWNESYGQLTGFLNSRQKLGLAISSSLSGNTITAEVKVHYDLAESGSQRLVVYLLENGLVYPQVNYYNNDSSSPWYQTGNPIQNFVHDHVALNTFTNVFGDDIPSNETATGSTYVKNYNINLPSIVQNSNNLELVAFVVGSDNKVLNAQKAALGETKDFD